MLIRIIFVILAIIGIAFVIPSNSFTDKITVPITKGIKKITSTFDDKVELPKIELPADTTTVHKWQDEDGKWHFSNTEPPPGVKSEKEIYKDDENVTTFEKPKKNN